MSQIKLFWMNKIRWGKKKHKTDTEILKELFAYGLKEELRISEGFSCNVKKTTKSAKPVKK